VSALPVMQPTHPAWETGRPDWANFRLHIEKLFDLGSFLKIHKVAHNFGLILRGKSSSLNFF
jgi:hypothetical protein